MKIERILGGFVSLGLAAALAVPVALAKSQATPPAQAAGKEGKEMGMHGGGLQAAVESLNLTDEQKAKVKDIFADAKAKHQAVSNDASLSEEQKKAKMKELHSATMAKLNEVLTPEQQSELRSKLEASKTKPPAQP